MAKRCSGQPPQQTMIEFPTAIEPRLGNPELERGGGHIRKRGAPLGAPRSSILQGSHGRGVRGEKPG